jgi:hypothetical protein
MKRLWIRWRDRLSDSRKNLAPEGAAASSTGVTYQIEGVNFVFGMDWRLLPLTRRLARALSLARQEGKRWYALSEMEDIIGYLDTALSARGPHYSAPLHLASRFSQGGLELFVFSLNGQRHAVIALQDSRPLPGYDALVDLPIARAMVDEFMAIQRGQPMRLVGNTTWLEGQETVEPEDLFVIPVKSARVRSMRSSRVVGQGVVAFTLVFLVLGGSVWGLERWRESSRAELQRSPAYQQNVYTKALDKELTALPAEPNDVLKHWRDVLQPLPLAHRGWVLTQVQCDLARCRAEWSSVFGSSADFLKVLPPGASLAVDVEHETEALVGKLITEHVFTVSGTSHGRFRDVLLGRREARRELGDFLHDLKLLGPSVSRIDAPRLLGSDQDPAVLVDPVFMGKWSLKHGLWILTSLQLPEFVRVQSLLLQLPGHKFSAPEATQSDDSNAEGLQKGEPTFAISGSYYAKH